MKIKSAFFALALLSAIFAFSPVSNAAQTLRIAVLNAGEIAGSQFFFNKFRQELAQPKNFRLVDDDLSRAAARGLNYPNLLNLSVEEAQNLGAAIDCSYFFAVKLSHAKRASATKPLFYEASAAIFLASARTGRLLAWERASFAADAAKTAEDELLDRAPEIVSRFVGKLLSAELKREQPEAPASVDSPVVLEPGAEENGGAENVRAPLPYRRLRPPYTVEAARAEAEATVDAVVDLDAAGNVKRVEIVRWAGFGLDEATVETIKKMQFRPAARDGEPLPVRFLLRYNFRRPLE